MSLTDLISSDVANVFLNTAELAVTVTRRVAGNSGHQESVTAQVFYDESERDDTSKESEVFDARLMIAAAQNALTTDVWMINGEKFRVVRTGKPNLGVKSLYLKRMETQQTETRASQ